jgi:hypothetical protein
MERIAGMPRTVEASETFKTGGLFTPAEFESPGGLISSWHPDSDTFGKICLLGVKEENRPDKGCSAS